MRRCDLRGSGRALGLLTTTLTPVEKKNKDSSLLEPDQLYLQVDKKKEDTPPEPDQL